MLDIVIDSLCVGLGIFGIVLAYTYAKELKLCETHRRISDMIWRRDYRALMLRIPDNGKAMVEIAPGLWTSKPTVEEVQELSKQIKEEVDKL